MGIAADLIEAAVTEIRERDPGFLDRNAVGFAPAEAVARRYEDHPLFAHHGLPGVVERLGDGRRLLASLGVRSSPAPGPQPLVARLLDDSIVDACAAEEGLLPLRPPAPERPLETALRADYEARETDGLPYLARRRGGRTLLLVNAIGIPLSAWGRLVADPDHDFRVLAVDAAAWDPTQDGVRAGGFEAEVERLRRILEAEAAHDVTVLGWCSAGRLAAEVAAREPHRLAQLVLASASFRGAMKDEPPPTRFEQDVREVGDALVRSPESATFLSRMLVQAQGAGSAGDDDAMLMRLPRRRLARDLTAPFADAERLKAYSTRLKVERDHRTAETLAKIQAPTLLVAGVHDQVIANACTLAVLTANAPQVQSVGVTGAGHYTHDLQYAYFRMLLEDTAVGRPPSLCARVRPL